MISPGAYRGANQPSRNESEIYKIDQFRYIKFSLRQKTSARGSGELKYPIPHKLQSLRGLFPRALC